MSKSVVNWKINDTLLEEDHDKTWDFCPEPLEGESFLSWFSRLAKENCSDVQLLYQIINSEDIKSIRNINSMKIYQELINIEIRGKKQRSFVERLAPFCKINSINPIIHPLDFKIESSDLLDRLITILPTPRYCPICLKNDKTPYIRKEWFYPFITYCDTHNILLRDSCPHCFEPVNFWNSDWDLSITHCSSCNKDFRGGYSITSEVSSNIQEILYDVLQKHIFNGEVVNPRSFFKILWKKVLENYKIPLLQDDSKRLTVEQMFRVLTETLKPENFIPISIEGMKYRSQFEYDFELLLNEFPVLRKNEKFLMRCKVLMPYFADQITSKHQIMDLPPKSPKSRSTIYKWMLVYRKDGIQGLIPKKKVNRKKSKWFPEEVHDIIEKHIDNFQKDNITMRKCRNKIIKESIALGYNLSQMPSQTTIAKRIHKKFD